MKKTLLLCVFMIMCCGIHYGQNTTSGETMKPTVALLGTFHFAGSTDALSMEIGDLTTPERQQQIMDVVEALSNYKPDKIILEYPYGKTKLDSLYQLYVTGKHTLSINERQQLGFRLAAKMGHKNIFTADHRMDLPFDELMQYLEEKGEMYRIQDMMAELKIKVMDEFQKVYDSRPLKEFFVTMNSDSFDAMNRNLYAEYINKMGSTEDYFGSNIVSTWWERNFRIMHNVDRIAEPGDRVLVIFGQGHTAILKEFYKTRSDVNYEDIITYLKNE